MYKEGFRLVRATGQITQTMSLDKENEVAGFGRSVTVESGNLKVGRKKNRRSLLRPPVSGLTPIRHSTFCMGHCLVIRSSSLVIPAGPSPLAIDGRAGPDSAAGRRFVRLVSIIRAGFFGA